MNTVDNLPETRQRVVIATAEHARSIADIYRSVLIEAQVLFDLVSFSAKRSSAARQEIENHGGFLSPPSDADMEMCLQHGLVMVCLLDGNVVGFNRYVTDPVTVRQALFSEFQLDTSEDYSVQDGFSDWLGAENLSDYKVLTRIHWIDREQAAIAVRAAQAGIQNKATGRLAWAIDSAVHPQNQHLGIGKALSNCMRLAVRPAVSCLAYRMFEIRKINNNVVGIHNDPSKKAFVGSNSKLFAYTEEEIDLGSGLKITARWNHWLKHYE